MTVGATSAVVAVVLVLSGVFSGPGSTGAQPAAAAVLRGVAAALKPQPGTIQIQQMHVTYTAKSGHPASFDLELGQETPVGPGPQNSLYFNSDQNGRPIENAVHGGEQEVYLKSTNTIYVTSIWAANISKGSRPGTFVYTPPQPPAGKSATLPPQPLLLTAAQARALRDGTDRISAVLTSKHIPYHTRLKVVPTVHFPSETASVRDLIRQHLVKVIGTTTVDGQPAIKLAGPKFDIHHADPNREGDAGVVLYVQPKTYVPIKQVIDRRPLFEDTQTWTGYKTLPITAANQRLLSLAARHPGAKMDRSRRDFFKAANGAAVFTG